MSELVFPLAAVGVTLFVLVPALIWVSRLALAWRRQRVTSWVDFGTETTFAWLLFPTLLPLVWLTSSALHQTEPEQFTEACRIVHVEATTCHDALVLLGFLLVGLLGVVLVRAWRERPRRCERVEETHPTARRVAAIVRQDPRLQGLSVQVARNALAPVYTVGWFSSQVILGACIARDADDEMIRATLLHEFAHITSKDTFRSFLVRVSLVINPAGRLLAPDFERWRHAREALCDSEAVELGGDPLALAESIVHAARIRGCCSLSFASQLCGHDLSVIKLRIALLLHGHSRPTRTVGHLALLAIGIVALLVPHLQSFGALDHFHYEVERLLHSRP
ncbi:MAG: hypothetical protein AUK47_28855 [Deltaproteobacteria bacterium CG2_30_63_29]|nr:MAG: hypothetical protein AUK47_28855 [Deltaproteobacteria bacterium CG2_30_63_29]